MYGIVAGGFKGRVLIATTPPPSGARAQAIPPKPHRAKPATTSPTPSLRLCEAKPSNLHRRQLRQLLPFFPSLSLSRWLAPRVWGDATRRDDRSVHKSVRRGLVRILPRCSRCRLVASLSVETPVTAAASLFTRWCFCVCVFVCVYIPRRAMDYTFRLPWALHDDGHDDSSVEVDLSTWWLD